MRGTYNRLSKVLTKEAGARREDDRKGAGRASAGNSAEDCHCPLGTSMNMMDSRKDLMPQEGVKWKAGFAYFLTNCPTSSCLLV